MSQLFAPALELGVDLRPDGAPAFVSGPLHGRLHLLEHWIAELDWWRNPVAREYWKTLVMQGGQEVLCELYHDLYQDLWFLERIYD